MTDEQMAMEIAFLVRENPVSWRALTDEPDGEAWVLCALRCYDVVLLDLAQRQGSLRPLVSEIQSEIARRSARVKENGGSPCVSEPPRA